MPFRTILLYTDRTGREHEFELRTGDFDDEEKAARLGQRIQEISGHFVKFEVEAT